MQIQSSQLHQNVTAFSKEQPLICEVAKVFILISFTDRDSKSHVGSNDLIEVVFVLNGIQSSCTSLREFKLHFRHKLFHYL